jgi:hypothetical protein
MTQKKTAVSPDDFQQIKGIGEAAARRLHEANIHTFDQLAEKSVAEIAQIVAGAGGRSADRILREDWIGQALQLADQAAPADALADNGQSYARFEVELLLEADNAVRRTKIGQRPHGPTEEWTGWDANRLTAFIADQTNLPLVESGIALSVDEFEGALRSLEIVDKEMKHPHRLLASDEVFDVCLEVHLPHLTSAAQSPLFYNAVIVAKNLSNGNRKNIGVAQGQLDAEKLSLSVPGSRLDPGTYRLQVELDFDSAPKQPLVRTLLSGGLLQVY